MEIRAKSGWLSNEQVAASEFARRVAVKHGIGVVAALMKKKDMVRGSAGRFLGRLLSLFLLLSFWSDFVSDFLCVDCFVRMLFFFRCSDFCLCFFIGVCVGFLCWGFY